MNKKRITVAIVVFVVVPVIAGVALSARTGPAPNDLLVAAQARKEAVRSIVPERPDVVVDAAGGRWSAGRATTSAGEVCVKVFAPTGWSSGTCMLEPAAGGASVDAIVAGTPDVTYVFGLARSTIKHLSLVTDDCKVESVRTANGVFLHVLATPGSQVKPYRLVARNAAGSVEDDRVLDGPKVGMNAAC